MTQDDIIRMAREAGLGNALCHNSIEGDRIWVEGADWHDEIERFAALVAAAEREACARVCESKMPQPVVNWSDAQIVEALRDCAAAIRGQA